MLITYTNPLLFLLKWGIRGMPNLYNWIQDRWEIFTWSGDKKKAPYGEMVRPAWLPDADYSNPKEKKITTTIDCYVTGSYVTNKGKIFTIRQRYSINVSYSSSTILETMQRVKQMLMLKFQDDNYGFDIAEVFIPPLTQNLPSAPQPRFIYRGGKIYKYLTRVEEGRFKLSVEKDIYKSRADRIIKRYGLKRREGNIN